MKKWHGSLTVILYGSQYQIPMEMSDLVIMLMASHSVQAALENLDILVFLNMVANVWYKTSKGMREMNYQDTRHFERATTPKLPIQPLLVLCGVMGCRSFQNIALGGLCKTHNLI